MAVFGLVWRVLSWTLCSIGVAAAVIVLPPGAWMSLGLLTLVAIVISLLCHESAQPRPQRTKESLVLVALAALALVTAALGMFAVLGAHALWLILLLAITSPPVTRWLVARLQIQLRSPVPDGPPTGTTTDLCRQWVELPATQPAKAAKDGAAAGDLAAALHETWQRDPHFYYEDGY